jgi:hypothetical protein
MLIVVAAGPFKRRRPPKLLLEFFAIAVALTGAAIGIYFGFRSPPLHMAWPLAARNIDVLRNANSQYEVSAARNPANARVLLAGSADGADDARVYESADAGTTWTTELAPPHERGPCGLAHPAVAIGSDGLQVYASLVSSTCQPPDPLLHVATRRGASGPWHVASLAPQRGFAFDQRPAVAVDSRGSIYVAWPRLIGEFKSHQILVLARSDDGGRTWSRPARIGRYTGVYSLDLAAAGTGELYLAVADGRGRRLDLLRSTDGGSTWPTSRHVAALVEPFVVGCGAGAVLLRGQPQRCVGPAPSVALSDHGIAVAYSEPEQNGTQGVFVGTLDRTLGSFQRPRRIGPSDRANSDQFLPVIGYDRSDGHLWACYYDTLGDSTRKHAWFTCTMSRDDGRRWARPVHAAAEPSNETPISADALGYGEHEALVVANGAAHPFWTDSRNLVDDGEDIYTAAIPASRLGH